MAVNIAAQQLAKPDFVDEVVDVLPQHRACPPSGWSWRSPRACCSTTWPARVAALARLRDRGVRVAIDDFGTGYSSLSYLAQLPVDVLKVDKSFVDQVGGGSADTSLVEAIIAMSHSMRLTTVAEGVEQAEQAAWLQHARCSMGQGYLWSRPVELAAAARAAAPRRHCTASRRPSRPARATGLLVDPLTRRRLSRGRSAGRSVSSTAGVLDRRGHRGVLAVGDLAHRLAQDLAAAGLRQPGDDGDVLERRDRRRSRRAPAATSSARDLVGVGCSTPALSTTNPRGTWPFSASATPITAHSATAGCAASTASIEPVESRCPATLMTSSVRPITKR